MTAAIELLDVTKAYLRGRQKISVLRHLNFSIDTGEFVAIMGPSGSGKTTLLNLIAGLDTPTSGEMKVNGERIDKLSEKSLARWRACNIGFVFQFYNLLPELTAARNVEVPLLLTDIGRGRRKSSVAAALELVGLSDRSNHRPNELSGGQQQRVSIARAIVADPAILVCDEPTGDLDRESAHGVLELLQTLSRSHGKTIIMVTHDPKAAEYSSRQLLVDKGCLVARPEAMAESGRVTSSGGSPAEDASSLCSVVPPTRGCPFPMERAPIISSGAMESGTVKNNILEISCSASKENADANLVSENSAELQAIGGKNVASPITALQKSREPHLRKASSPTPSGGCKSIIHLYALEAIAVAAVVGCTWYLAGRIEASAPQSLTSDVLNMSVSNPPSITAEINPAPEPEKIAMVLTDPKVVHSTKFEGDAPPANRSESSLEWSAPESDYVEVAGRDDAESTVTVARNSDQLSHVSAVKEIRLASPSTDIERKLNIRAQGQENRKGSDANIRRDELLIPSVTPPERTGIGGGDRAGSKSAQAYGISRLQRAENEILPESVNALERIRWVAPQFPDLARRKNIVGWVLVEFTVTPDGRTKDISVTDSSKPGIFDGAVIRSVRKWRYHPPMRDGRPVSKRAQVRVRFASADVAEDR